VAEKRNLIRDYSIALSGAVLVAILFRIFILEAFRMPSRAMSPSVEPGDTLFVKKWKPYFSKDYAPTYGDILVFKFPNEDRTYIKRVVGMPKDTVEVRNGILYLNQVPQTRFKTEDELCGEETLPNGKSFRVCREKPLLSMGERIELKESEYFMLGDFRALTPDLKRTKAYGVLPVKEIIGEAFLVWISIQQDSSGFKTIRFDRMFKNIQ
jgi:signal peptidase I